MTDVLIYFLGCGYFATIVVSRHLVTSLGNLGYNVFLLKVRMFWSLPILRFCYVGWFLFISLALASFVHFKTIANFSVVMQLYATRVLS